jgi:osmotically-inducible protein OsmY
MSNADIQNAIQRAIRNDSSLANSNVNVAVTQDAIELTGNLATNADKDTVRHIAEQYAGSRKIVDRDLTVR